MLARQPNSAAKIAFAWRMAAGLAMARHGTPRWSEDGVLTVEAGDAAWRRELRYARPVLLERLRELLGADVVRKLEVK